MVSAKNDKEIYLNEDTQVEEIENPVETEIPPSVAAYEDVNEPPKRKKKRRKIIKKLERHNIDEELNDSQPYRLDE